MRTGAMTKKLLVLKDIHKGYGRPGSHGFRPVLSGLEWELEAGTRTAIVGPSGCGKTTLLNLIGALDRPDRGNPVRRPRHQRIQRCRTCPVPQPGTGICLPAAPSPATADPSRECPASFACLSERGNHGTAGMGRPSAPENGHQRSAPSVAGELSGGECQRTAVVRALIHKPRLLLADEPTGALDEENASILAGLLTGLSRDEGITLVTVTHAPEVAAGMERIFHLRNGQLIL